MSEDIDKDIEDLEILIKRQERIISITKRAEEKYLINLHQLKLRLQCEAKVAPPMIQKQYDEVQQLIKLKIEQDDNTTYGYMINCNPDERIIDLLKFKELCKKAMSKIWITDFVWVLEQRGETIDEIGKGFHFHALIKPTEGKRPSQVVREFTNSFKKATDTGQWNFFQIKYLKKDEFERKISYLVGWKSEKHKNLKQQYDVLWRKNNDIPKAYYSENFDFKDKWIDIPEPN